MMTALIVLRILHVSMIKEMRRIIILRLEDKMTNSVDIKIGINTEITESTANGCLKIVEMFLNHHPEMTAIPCEYRDGNL